MREVRAAETTAQRDARLEENRLRNDESRAAESSEQREARLEEQRLRSAESRAAETCEQHDSRLQLNRLRIGELRAAETPQEYHSRLEEQRQRAAESRATETPGQRISRLEGSRLRTAETRAAETPEQRDIRRDDNRLRTAESRAAETPEQRDTRREDNRLRMTETRAAETSEQHATRLEDNRLRMTESRAAETPEQREDRLQNERMQRLHSRQTFRRADLRLAAFRYDPNYNYREHPRVVIGKMDVICPHCQAKRFRGETPGMCCSGGKVKLPPLNPPPEPLLSYMPGTTTESKHFLQNIRRYNSCFQMTSFGTTATVQEGGFMPTFKVKGQIYHRVGSLLPLPSETPKFLQIYFMGDEEQEVNQRCENTDGTRRNIVLNLQRMFHQHNNLVKVFKTALERMPTDEYRIVIRADKRPAGEHERRFNAPTVNEVAVVMVEDEFERRDIIIQKRNDSLQRISETHRSYDALQYPILFWEGEDGYHFNIMQTDPRTGLSLTKKVSAKDFYANRIMIRDASTNHLLKCRQLFHQFIVDMYAKIESERLLYIRLNQRKLRVDDYIHLRDAIANDGNSTDVGRLVILPATYTGSPRHMHEYAQDAMLYVRTCGRPDLFITFTCNPEWTEIKDELFPGQVPSDRHDLIARVFKQKLSKFMDVITKSHIFGETRCWLYSVEWQKRGLPHAHVLIWLKDKIHPTQIDAIISAEIPNPEQDPGLFEIVTKSMIHGPCGSLNPTSPCMKDRKCSKRYPREFIQETQTGNDGYPLYRRRKPGEGGFAAVVKMRVNNQQTEIEVDNRWVVPYNPLLSKMFEAHINVEYCNSVKSIKYICKYVTKGNDMAVFRLEDENRALDEILQYLMGRFINTNEGVWHILCFSIHECYPPVVHLSVHLENGQRIYFTADAARERAANPPNTTLTAFFQLCQQDSFARTLLYPEVPKYYTWNTSRKVFCKRKQGAPVPGTDVRESDALGRVYTVHPNNDECYFLRLLLHTVRGPTSFADLKIVDGEVCETYREACQRRGLLENDQH
ncbi:hypothetical protein ANCCAN_05042 [Ancylostoma caninum]|uniref:Uncharacterized protein n=1 Tax=Ancylostoma caninum TaxID=29170 RepID=A0A368GX53_ANCCA|nr:hypothetical protein ANCCAN_05042 [Ancylostoma caninum]